MTIDKEKLTGEYHADVNGLLAEIERLEERNVYWIDQANTIAGDRNSIRNERDQLKAENEDYKSGQERYEQIIEDLKAENEALRKQIADLWPLKNVPPQDFRASNKCLACGEYHHGLSGLPCPKMTPVAQAFAGVNQRVVPVEPLRIPHPLEAMAKEASQ